MHLKVVLQELSANHILSCCTFRGLPTYMYQLGISPYQKTSRTRHNLGEQRYFEIRGIPRTGLTRRQLNN